MDTLSIVIMLIIAFLGWTQGMTWLFYGALALVILFSRSLGVAVLIGVGVAIMVLLNLQEYWYIILVGIVVILLLTKGREEQGDMGMYSPELMQLLGGQ